MQFHGSLELKYHSSCHLYAVIAKLKRKIRVFFGFSSAETNGLLLLIPIVLLILSVPSILRKILEGQDEQNNLEDARILQAWLEESRSKIKAKKEPIITPTSFNPNKITFDQWIALGFDKKIAHRIINYREKGGTFRKKKDLLKIYGINKELVMANYDYIILPEARRSSTLKTLPSKGITKERATKKKIIKIDLNLADTAQLRQIKGIGPVLSSRIIKYRKALGGFTHMSQLKEVYGIKNDIHQKIKTHFNIQATDIQKVNINQDSIKLLARHPYISYPISRAIVKYRKQHGDYRFIEELKNIHIISDSIYQIMVPYIEASGAE